MKIFRPGVLGFPLKQLTIFSLCLVLVNGPDVIGGLLPGREAAALAAEDGTTASKYTTTRPSREGIVRETNRARAGHALKPLKENDLLNRIAEERLEDLLEHDYFGHVSPSGERVDAVARRRGYHFRLLGENLAKIYPKATSRRFVDGWMKSPPHRKNILNPQYQDIGVAVKKGRLGEIESWVAVQVFGSR